jgi:hypothetical protein
VRNGESGYGSGWWAGVASGSNRTHRRFDATWALLVMERHAFRAIVSLEATPGLSHGKWPLARGKPAADSVAPGLFATLWRRRVPE